MFVNVPHGKLFYHTIEPLHPWTRQPKAVVFLHGVGATHALWSDWVDVLAPSCRLILIDTRGCGQSSDIGQLDAWSLDAVSDDILAAADAAGADDIHVIAESFGGTAALNLATRALARVKTVTVLSTAHRGGQIERVRQWRQKITDEGITGWSQQMMQWRFFPGALTAEKSAWFQSVQDQTRAEPLLHKGEMLLQTDLTDKLPKVTCPLLMISPDRSPFVTPDIPLEILQHVDSADLAVLPHTRHGIFYSHGRECAQMWLTFQQRVARRLDSQT